MKAGSGVRKNSKTSFLQEKNTSSFSSLQRSHCKTHIKNFKFLVTSLTLFLPMRKNLIFYEDGQFYGEDRKKICDLDQDQDHLKASPFGCRDINLNALHLAGF